MTTNTIPDPNGCPACGQDIDRLGGNEDCETCAAEPSTATLAVIDEGDPSTWPCDECGHVAPHPSANDDANLWPFVTCWAELVCQTCHERTRAWLSA